MKTTIEAAKNDVIKPLHRRHRLSMAEAKLEVSKPLTLLPVLRMDL